MNIHLLNGSKAPRERSSDGVTVLGCGCALTVYNDIQTYAQMCEPHHAEWRERHDAAGEAHRAQMFQEGFLTRRQAE